jgi:lysophospholipase L1-like esterase
MVRQYALVLLLFFAPHARGLDVPFVPTPENVVAKMLELANVGPADVVYDLGSGDGRIVIAAARRHGARGVGIDIDPQRVREARANARKAGVAGRVEFHEGDLFKADIGAASVVTLYLLPSLNLRLRPKLLAELKPGTRIVSYGFDMGDWAPGATLQVGSSTVYYWVVVEPKALLIGDSISVGYTKATAMALNSKAAVHHKGSAQDTRSGLKNIDAWLGDTKWDVIHFNWGLWDLRRDRGELLVPLAEYENNLAQLVERLKKTQAKLIFATTTPVPQKNAHQRRDSDVRTYNAAALAIMRKHGVAVNDLHAPATQNLASWQKKDDVHFTDAGSAALGTRVAKAIEAALTR